MTSTSERPSPHQDPLLQNRLGWAVFALLIMALPSWLVFEELRQETHERIEAPPIFAAPESMPLLDQDGRVVQLDSFRGSILVVSFLFTRCPDVCPALAARFVELESRVPAEIAGVPVHFISITVDPEYDQPEVLRSYRARFGDDLPRWQLWTGESTAIDATVLGFQQALDRREGEDAPTIVHSERFIVLDPLGRMRNFYPSDEPGMAQLEVDLPIIAAGF